jgi:hypothetical protein
MNFVSVALLLRALLGLSGMPMQPVHLRFQLSQAMGSRIELAYVASDGGSLKLVRQHRFSPHAIEKHLSPSGRGWYSVEC